MRFAPVLIGLLCAVSLLFAATGYRSYSYTLENPLTHPYSSLNVNLYQTLNPATVNGSTGVYAVCVGDTVNLRDYIEYTSAFPDNMGIRSYCDAATSIEECNKNAYNIISSYGIGGTTVLLSSSEYNTIKNSNKLSYYQPEGALSPSEKTVVNKIANANGGAWLWRNNPSGTQVKYANSRGGLGCFGTYSMSVTRPDGSTVTPTGSSDELYKLSGANVNYKFDQAGQYTVTYSTTISGCAGILKELFKDNSPATVHTFREKTSGLLPFSMREQVKFNVVSWGTPDLTASNPTIDPVLDPNTGTWNPQNLTEGESGTFTIRFKLKNSGNSAVTLVKVSPPVDTGTNPVQITVNSRVPTDGSVIKAGEEVEVKIDARGTAPLNSAGWHSLRIDYSYEASAIGVCAGRTSERKTGTVYASLGVSKKDQPPQDTLQLVVNVLPPAIDQSNFEKINKEGVSVTGTVLLQPNNRVPQPAANVTLIRIEKNVMDANCAPPRCPYRRTTCYDSPIGTRTDANGRYNFTNIKLDKCQIGADEIGALEATVDARHNALFISAVGRSSISTPILPPTCVLTYKRVPGAVEKYTFTIKVNNWLDSFDAKSATYDCGDGSGPRKISENAKTFECTYGMDLTPEASRAAVYTLNYAKYPNQRQPYPQMTCQATVGMCYFQLG